MPTRLGRPARCLLTVAKDRNGGVGVKGSPVAQIHFMPAADNRTIVSFRHPQKKEAEGPAKPTIIIHRIENLSAGGDRKPTKRTPAHPWQGSERGQAPSRSWRRKDHFIRTVEGNNTAHVRENSRCRPADSPTRWASLMPPTPNVFRVPNVFLRVPEHGASTACSRVPPPIRGNTEHDA